MLKIVPAEFEHYEFMLDLTVRTMGAGFLDLDDLCSEDIEFFIALENDILVGFGGVEIWEEKFTKEDPVLGLLGWIAVEPNGQRKGIGTKLVQFGTKVLEFELGADLIVSYAWSDHNGTHLAKPLERNGYVAVERKIKHWANDPDTGRRCVTCGYPCLCDAVIYQKWVNKDLKQVQANLEEKIYGPQKHDTQTKTMDNHWWHRYARRCRDWYWRCREFKL